MLQQSTHRATGNGHSGARRKRRTTRPSRAKELPPGHVVLKELLEEFDIDASEFHSLAAVGLFPCNLRNSATPNGGIIAVDRSTWIAKYIKHLRDRLTELECETALVSLMTETGSPSP